MKVNPPTIDGYPNPSSTGIIIKEHTPVPQPLPNLPPRPDKPNPGNQSTQQQHQHKGPVPQANPHQPPTVAPGVPGGHPNQPTGVHIRSRLTPPGLQTVPQIVNEVKWGKSRFVCKGCKSIWEKKKGVNAANIVKIEACPTCKMPIVWKN